MSYIKPTDNGQKFLSKQATPADRTAISAVQLYEKQYGSQGASGNTVFSLQKPYLPGTHTLIVFLNGQKLELGNEYAETNALTVTFASALADTDVVEFMVMGHYRVADSELESALLGLEAYDNLLINPQFTINQRVYAGTALSAGSYGYDRWRAGASGGTASLSGDILTISAGAFVQRIEEANMVNGETYTISWEGTAQVWDFATSGYVDGPLTFVYDSSWGYGSGYCTIAFGTGTLQKPVVNKGAAPLAFRARVFAQELALCQRYFCKSYDVATAPGTATITGEVYWLIAKATNVIGPSVRWPVQMRTTPTITHYSPNSGASGYVYDLVATADVQVVNRYGHGETGIGYTALSATQTDGDVFTWQYTADAEL